jgi:hypothetical protein
MNLKEFPDELQKALKIRAIEEGTTLQKLVIRYCQEGLERDNQQPKKKGR